MKRIILILVISIFSFTAISQTVLDVVKQEMGKPATRNTNQMFKTEFGLLTFRLKESNGYVKKILIKLTNGQPNYSEIIEGIKYDELKVGSTWTDIIFNYNNLETKKFKSLKEAKVYYKKLDKKQYDIFNDLHIYKMGKKEKYIVGVFPYTKVDYGNILKTDMKGTTLKDNWIVVE